MKLPVTHPNFPAPPPCAQFSLDGEARLSQDVPVLQVRLAVSMVGGSALCLYENGVAQELFRAVHGHGLYGVLKRLTHSHCFVDVLSGTSAGGINTILLSTALVCGTDFRRTREVWIRLASIDNLMQNPRDGKATSLLKGDEFYTRELESVFEELGQPPDATTARNVWTWRSDQYHDGAASIASGLEPMTAVALEQTAPKSGTAPSADPPLVYRDLDLFVTGTYFQGRLQTFFDARNQPLFTRNHEGVFHLKHRPRRAESHFLATLQEPSDAYRKRAQAASPDQRARAVSRRLARIARTTSSLPAVFEPSQVCDDLMMGVIDLPQSLPAKGANGGAAPNTILDGGFLNNRPLNLVLKEVYSRATGSEVARKVLLVEPDPESAQQTAPPTAAPNALETLLFYRNVGGYQSLAKYLESVSQHNERVRRVNEILSTTRDAVAKRRADPTARDIWRTLSSQALRDELLDAWKAARGLKSFGALEDGDQTTAVSRHARVLHEAQALEALGRALLVRMESWGAVNAAPTSYPLEDVDVSFLRRRVMRAQSEIYQTLYPQPAARAPSQNAQSRRQEVFQTLKDFDQSGAKPRFEAAQVYVRELFHLADLSTIVGRCLTALLGAIAHTPTFYQAREAVLQAPNAPPTAEVNALWDLLVAALRLLLEDGRDTIIRVSPAELPDSDQLDERRRAAKVLQTRHSEEAQGLGRKEPLAAPWNDPQHFAAWLTQLPTDAALHRSFYELSLPTRCEIICQAIRFGAAESETFNRDLIDNAGNAPAQATIFADARWSTVLARCQALQLWGSALPAPNAVPAPNAAPRWTVLSRLNRRLDAAVAGAATQIQPLFVAPAPVANARANAANPPTRAPDLPLRWAYDPKVRRQLTLRLDVLPLPLRAARLAAPPTAPDVIGEAEIGQRLREFDYYTFPGVRLTQRDEWEPLVA